MARRRRVRVSRSPEREIDLGAHPQVEGLEVIEVDPEAAAPEPPPVHLLEGLPGPPEAAYEDRKADATSSKGLWTAIEHLDERNRPR